MVVFLNDKFIDEAAAMLHVADLSIQRGYAVFDFFRTSNNVPLFFDDYLDRFYASASGLGLDLPLSKEELRNTIREMITRNNLPESGFRMILTGGYSSDSFEPASPNLFIIQQPLVLPSLEKFNKGLKIILHEYMRDLPAIKSTNYLIGIWLRNKVREKNADEVLYHKDGKVLEFPRSNVFIVTKDQVVVTPSENVLMGVTRKKILELARKKYKVEERQVTLEELKSAQEVFLSSTTKRILPVLRVDDTPVGEGKVGAVATWLYNGFLDHEVRYVGVATRKNETLHL